MRSIAPSLVAQSLAALGFALLALAACDAPAQTAAAPAPGAAAEVRGAYPTEVAWRKNDVLAAFDEAAETGKPILLYWSAEWCPPCHRLRATLFQDAGFVALANEDFVPVYLDGDTEGAQRWGEHFAIQGYPTMILLRQDRTEITRLSGDSEPDEIAAALRAAHQSQTGAADLFARAQAEPERLSADDWSLIAAYGWDIDVSGLFPEEERAGLLRGLAAAAPDPTLERRFALLALAADDAAATLDPTAQADVRDLLSTILADAEEVRRSRWPLTYDGPGLIARATQSPEERKAFEDRLVAALDALVADERVPIVDRVLAVNADLEIHRLNVGADAPTPPELLEKVQARAAWADEAAQTPAERQSAIYYAAGVLEDAGDAAGAERLLLAELERSATPFYYMPSLADLAEARGDDAQALDWLRQGYETSTGPATRAQWGILYADGVLRLAPDDLAGVEDTVGRVVDELAAPDSYHQRTRSRFTQLEAVLLEWSAAREGAGDALSRLRTRMHEVCAPAQSDEEARAACLAWLSQGV